MTTLYDIGEVEAIRRLTAHLPSAKQIVLGPGDDCAVVRCGAQDMVLTSDPVIEGVHFDDAAGPRSVGHKAIGRALSDLAAMGAAPTCALVNVVAPGDTSSAYLEAVYEGITRISESFELPVAGGDLARGPQFELHVFAMGTLPRGSAIRRSGARPGDDIYVTGGLGYSSLGKHLSFTPRVRQGLWLREKGWASAMIDLSDGLASDLPHLLECSRAGARLTIAAIPISDARPATDDQRRAVQHALTDGEDFELLFTLPAAKSEAFEREWQAAFDLSCTCIGQITAEAGRLTLVDRNGGESLLETTGYQHFRDQP